MSPEGDTSILSFEPEGLYSQPSRPFATPNICAATNAPYVPKWVQPRYGVRFGFGNKLVTYDAQQQSVVRVHHKGTNQSLVEKVQEFDRQLESLSPAQVCEGKSKNAVNDFDMMEFKVLKCLFEKNYDGLLKQFGIDKNKALFEVERVLGRKVR